MVSAQDSTANGSLVRAVGAVEHAVASERDVDALDAVIARPRVGRTRAQRVDTVMVRRRE